MNLTSKGKNPRSWRHSECPSWLSTRVSRAAPPTLTIPTRITSRDCLSPTMSTLSAKRMVSSTLEEYASRQRFSRIRFTLPLMEKRSTLLWLRVTLATTTPKKGNTQNPATRHSAGGLRVIREGKRQRKKSLPAKKLNPKSDFCEISL